MEVVDKIYQHCDNREVTMGIYLDLQKAFDTVIHPILIEKLATYAGPKNPFLCPDARVATGEGRLAQ